MGFMLIHYLLETLTMGFLLMQQGEAIGSVFMMFHKKVIFKGQLE